MLIEGAVALEIVRAREHSQAIQRLSAEIASTGIGGDRWWPVAVCGGKEIVNCQICRCSWCWMARRTRIRDCRPRGAPLGTV